MTAIAKELKSSTERWPELDRLADELASYVAHEINSRSWDIKTKEPMPYKAQFVLEMLISKLQKAV